MNYSCWSNLGRDNAEKKDKIDKNKRGALDGFGVNQGPETMGRV